MSSPLLIFCIFLASGFASVDSQLSNHIHRCYHCAEDEDARQGAVYDPLSCRHTKLCADDEACRATTRNLAGVITHEFRCHSLLQCQILTILYLQYQGIATGVDFQHLQQTGVVVGRKRQINMCDICCGDDLCNDNSCDAIRSAFDSEILHANSSACDIENSLCTSMSSLDTSKIDRYGSWDQ